MIGYMDFGAKIERCPNDGNRLEETFIPGRGFVKRCEYCKWTSNVKP